MDKVEKTTYDSAFSEALKDEEKTPDVNSIYSEYVSPLGQKLETLFKDAEGQRSLIEQRWLMDLRQVRGEYEPSVLEKLHPKRSKAFLSLTRSKVKTITSRMTDLLFPANGVKNWGIGPTPIPELSPQVEQSIMEQLAQVSEQMPDQAEVMKVINDEATRRSSLMEDEMHDQLTALKYREIIRNCIDSGGIFGTGVLKGPLAKEKIAKRWVPTENGGWASVEIPSMLPYCEFVPVWDIYPDMTARKVEDMRYVFQRYAMNKNQLYELGQRGDFNQDAVNAYLKAYPEGDANFKVHEEQLRNLSSAPETTPSSASRLGKYEVREFWGFLSSDEMKSLGVEIPYEQLGMEFAANVWTIGPVIIKGIVSPLKGVTFPYHFYYYEKDDTSIFGEGVPVVMRNIQSLFNAAVRAMLDNAAISAGPIIEANLDLLHPGEDPTDLFPFKVFRREGVGIEASQKAITVHTLPSYTNELMAMIKLFIDLADEVTSTPRYLAGNDAATVRGAGRTASGLSMLMGAANITLKDQVKNFDDGITIPFIKGLYFWNMQFNPKQNIKGDFGVAAKGSSSLIAKEVRAEHLNTFLTITNNEIDQMYTNRDNVLREVAKNLDLDDLDLIKSKDQVQKEEQQRSIQAQKNEQFEKEIAMLKAQSGGHMGGAAASGLPEGLNIGTQ
jgi:hypothetical protein